MHPIWEKSSQVPLRMSCQGSLSMFRKADQVEGIKDSLQCSKGRVTIRMINMFLPSRVKVRPMSISNLHFPITRTLETTISKQKIRISIIQVYWRTVSLKFITIIRRFWKKVKLSWEIHRRKRLKSTMTKVLKIMKVKGLNNFNWASLKIKLPKIRLINNRKLMVKIQNKKQRKKSPRRRNSKKWSRRIP